MLQRTVLVHIHAKKLSAQARKGIAQGMGGKKEFSHLGKPWCCLHFVLFTSVGVAPDFTFSPLNIVCCEEESDMIRG